MDLIESRSRIREFVREKGFGNLLEKLLEPPVRREISLSEFSEFYSDIAGLQGPSFGQMAGLGGKEDLEKVISAPPVIRRS
jgi:hypothetical protein